MGLTLSTLTTKPSRSTKLCLTFNTDYFNNRNVGCYVSGRRNSFILLYEYPVASHTAARYYFACNKRARFWPLVLQTPELSYRHSWCWLWWISELKSTDVHSHPDSSGNSLYVCLKMSEEYGMLEIGSWRRTKPFAIEALIKF